MPTCEEVIVRQDQFVSLIEEYLADVGMSPTKFGHVVLNDPKFVFNMREGRECKESTRERVFSYIRENPPTGEMSTKSRTERPAARVRRLVAELNEAISESVAAGVQIELRVIDEGLPKIVGHIREPL